jgi:hypothetical protein
VALVETLVGELEERLDTLEEESAEEIKLELDSDLEVELEVEIELVELVDDSAWVDKLIPTKLKLELKRTPAKTSLTVN